MVDYTITSDSLFNDISSFRIGNFIPWISDHCPILYNLEVKEKIEEKQKEKDRKQAPKQYIWTEESLYHFKRALQNRLEVEHNELWDFSDPNQTVDYLTGLMINVADEAKVKIKKQPLQSYNDPPWFDKECTSLKNEIRELGKKRKCDPDKGDICSKIKSGQEKPKKLGQKEKEHV